MKKLVYIIISVVLITSVNGCKKYLDVNKDPNNPLDVSPDLILGPVETEIATVVAGIFLVAGICYVRSGSSCYFNHNVDIDKFLDI